MRPIPRTFGKIRARMRTKITLIILKIFTSSAGCGIIFSVKRTLTVLLCAATAAATLTCGAAFGLTTKYADAATTVYPDFVSELDLGGFDSYAVGENQFAFSKGSQIYIYEGGSADLTTDASGMGVYVYEGGVLVNDGEALYAYDHASSGSSANITDMSYCSEGLLFSDGSGVYLYSGGTVTESDQTIPPVQSGIITNGSLAYSVDDGTLRVTDMAAVRTDFPAGRYTDLKVIGGNVYALLDGGLCVVAGTSITNIAVIGYTFRYTDESQGETIAVGNTAQLLKNPSAQYRLVPAGQYVTEIDLSDLSGAYFVTVGSEETPATRRTDTECYALVLCTTGNADIIAIGSKTYVTYTTSVKANLTTSAAPFEQAKLNYPAGIYSMPYMCEATKLLSLDTGAEVSVLSQITADGQAQADGALEADFCRVVYVSDDGTATSGYVATAFLTVYNFSGEDGEFTEPTAPEDYSEENVILTVVLVIVIVVLVIAGVAYLAYVSGSNRRKKKNKTEGDGGDTYDNDFEEKM